MYNNILDKRAAITVFCVPVCVAIAAFVCLFFSSPNYEDALKEGIKTSITISLTFAIIANIALYYKINSTS